MRKLIILVIAILGISISSKGQKGFYVGGNVGYSYNFRYSESLHAAVELKTMVSPYLGVVGRFDKQMYGYKASMRLNFTTPEGSIGMSLPVEVSMETYSLGLAFHPIAIVNPETRHLLSLQLDAGFSWSKSTWKARKIASMLDIRYAYVAWKPLCIGWYLRGGYCLDFNVSSGLYLGLSLGGI